MKQKFCIFLICLLCICSFPYASAAAAYVDVSESAWYAEAVDYVTDHGIMQGTGNNKFSPDTVLTRGQFVTLLYRMSGSPQVAAETAFRDVPTDAYYAKPITWASEKGIVSGTSSSTFSPDTTIIREQLATIICRYIQAEGLELPTAQNPVSGLKDTWYVSAYAEEGVQLVWRTGIMNGDSQHNFGPKVAVTRAEAADVFMRLDRCMAGESLKVVVRDTTPDYTSMSQQTKDAQALTVAKQIASVIPSDYTDLGRVSIAARIVAYYCSFDVYTMDGTDYRTPFGVFVKGEYSCAGATRALGLVLDCMGYQWTHVNENQYGHQWCSLYMDGQLGWADGQVGLAGYGER